MLGKIPLSLLGLTVGGFLVVIGFVAYAAENATLNLVGFFYGFPLLLGGFALKVSELKPTPFTIPTTPEILTLRKQQATVTQNKLRNDVTRFRYGQDVHLDEALAKVGLSPSEGERPTLDGLREVEIDGAYTLVLEFDSPKLTLEKWESRKEKMERFFGPDIQAEVVQASEGRIELALVRTLGEA